MESVNNGITSYCTHREDRNPFECDVCSPGVTITFRARPIETAPQDKCLYLYDEKYWQPGHWLPERGMEPQNCWINSDACEVINPTHWCYPHEMEVPS